MSDVITVRVRVFAALREKLGFADRALEFPAGVTVAELVRLLDESHPSVDLVHQRFRVAVNRSYAERERVLTDGDEVGLIPPVSGGAVRLFEVTDQPISIDEVARRVTAPDVGGVTLFAGTVRGITQPGDRDPFVTNYLEYEAYPEMAEAKLAEIAGEARARWPQIGEISIVHRVGRLEIGEVAVVIAVGAAHRSETFDACHYVIDRIKRIAPIWKREVGPDGTEWVEGPESDVAPAI